MAVPGKRVFQYLGKIRNPNPELEAAAPVGSAHGGHAEPTEHAGQGAGAQHPASGGHPMGTNQPMHPGAPEHGEGEHK